MRVPLGRIGLLDSMRARIVLAVVLLLAGSAAVSIGCCAAFEARYVAVPLDMGAEPGLFVVANFPAAAEEELRSTITLVTDEVDRMNRLVEDLLVLARAGWCSGSTTAAPASRPPTRPGSSPAS